MTRFVVGHKKRINLTIPTGLKSYKCKITVRLKHGYYCSVVLKNRNN